MVKLETMKTKPLILATPDMVAKAPCYNTASNTNIESVENRVKVMEKSLSDFMNLQKHQNEKINGNIECIKSSMKSCNREVPPASP